jgi:hypothetical protein
MKTPQQEKSRLKGRNRLVALGVTSVLFSAFGLLAPAKIAFAQNQLTLKTNCPAGLGPIVTDSTTSGAWIGSYGSCGYVLPSYKLPYTGFETPIFNPPNVNIPATDGGIAYSGSVIGSIGLRQPEFYL